MDRIFNDACDKNVAVRVIYANSSNALFYDSELTKAVPTTDVLNLYLKGIVVLKSGTYYTPKTCTTAGVLTFAS